MGPQQMCRKVYSALSFTDYLGWNEIDDDFPNLDYSKFLGKMYVHRHSFIFLYNFLYRLILSDSLWMVSRALEKKKANQDGCS